MKNVISLLTIIFCLISCQNPAKKNTQNAFRQAAEYEPTEAVWLLYPQVTHKKSESINEVTLEIIQALAPYTKIKFVVPNDSVAVLAKKLIPENLLKNNTVSILKFPYREFWARDFGPSFLINENGEKAMADFMFNTWGYNDTSDVEAKIDEKLDEAIANYYKIPIISTNIVSEGGDHELNSKGTLLLVEAVEKHRNPGQTLNEIADEFKRVLGVTKVIWLKQGVRDDDNSTLGKIEGPNKKMFYTVLTTNGHVDEFARFVNDSTILLAWVKPEDRSSAVEIESAKRMEVNYNILKNAKDQNGKSFKIIKVPMPFPVLNTLQPGDGVYDILSQLTYIDGSKFPKGKPVDVIAAASYLNFLIANKVVLMAKYWKPNLPLEIKKRDEEAFYIIQNAFPDKKVIAINTLAVNLGGGGIHCITINEPQAFKK